MSKGAECIFCKIIKDKEPASRVYEDELFIAIEDNRPQAPIHYLVIPKRHISEVRQITEDDKEFYETMVLDCRKACTRQRT